jgi:hypothetical protein
MNESKGGPEPPQVAKPVPPLENAVGLLSAQGAMKGLSDVAPLLITGFMFMNTIFNYDLKAFFWVGPLVAWLLLLKLVQGKLSKDKIENAACGTLWGTHKSPAMSSFFIMYTLGYIAAPMPINNDWNIIAIIMFLALFGVDAASRLKNECASVSGVAVGGVVGLALGVFVYFGFSWAGLGKFMYYTSGDSNNVYCSKPKEQNFKCHVYKNGNIISTI